MHPRAKKALDSFLREDIGRGDITSNLLPRKKISARIISRQHGIIAGTRYSAYLFSSKNCTVRILKKDGSHVRPNDTIMTISGPAYSVLSCERTALNLMSRMSGIATTTGSLVKIIKQSSRRTDLYSTRKTAPGLRHFDKEAVEIGGGKKHRTTLDEMVMIKDNHLAVSPLEEIVAKAKRRHKRFEVEVENLHDAVAAARGGASIIMLDNIPPAGISRIIRELERLGLRKKLRIEASGGIDISNIRSYARTGVDMISIGKLTSSVQGLDLSLEV
ncbi:MAG TPA: carboxylating nicotinate-nucleotide diphosphorylase [Candidatus Nitrosotalea sp.]|nr:carboxylating nicotinate-nucleotide diphosphorylase [Candidatus Nitrosotalea sp.]